MQEPYVTPGCPTYLALQTGSKMWGFLHVRQPISGSRAAVGVADIRTEEVNASARGPLFLCQSDLQVVIEDPKLSSSSTHPFTSRPVPTQPSHKTHMPLFNPSWAAYWIALLLSGHSLLYFNKTAWNLFLNLLICYNCHKLKILGRLPEWRV